MCNNPLVDPLPQHSYNINHYPLDTKDQHSYLGVTIHKSMSWASHINTLVHKATRTLNFIKQNLHKCSKEVKETAYLTLVRPSLEYASCVWDPHQLYLISNIEKIQRRAARWILSDFSRYSSVSTMLAQLQWSSLEKRRSDSRLCTFYRILHDSNIPIKVPQYFMSTQYPTRNDHPFHFILPYTSTTYYKQSFFPRTIKQWNNLPLSIINSTSLSTFSLSLKSKLNL